MICGTNALGYSQFDCPKCKNSYTVFHTCKSRFCPSCGIKYIKQRLEVLESTILNVKHRHLVFTIPKELRPILREDRYNINFVFEAVRITLLEVFEEKGLIPGFVSVLHTFGRNIKWNPHIHVLLTEGGLNKKGKFITLDYISFELLRKKYQYNLLNIFSKI